MGSSQTKQQQPTVSQQLTKKESVDISNIQNPFVGSTIIGKEIKDTLVMQFIFTHIILDKKTQFKLVFRASDNEFSAKMFHQKCHNVGPTLMFAITDSGNVFGGYTPCKWLNDIMYGYQVDKQGTSCLFRIGDQEQGVYQLKMDCNQKAIMNHKSEGPIFGEGHDLIIKDFCNQNESWSNLGKSYQCLHKFASNRANQSLTKQRRFFVKQYEIWEILKPQSH